MLQIKDKLSERIEIRNTYAIKKIRNKEQYVIRIRYKGIKGKKVGIIEKEIMTNRIKVGEKKLRTVGMREDLEKKLEWLRK